MTERVFDYIAEAQLTKSSSFHGELVSKQAYIDVLIDCIKSLQTLDRIKKALFYGKGEHSLTLGSKATCSEIDLIGLHPNPHKGIDIIHGIIGKATEAGELLEALFESTIGHQALDKYNIREEVGDGFWYDAILLSAIDSNFGEAQAINISKLRSRYPNKFTEYDAVNRNLKDEREILETVLTKTTTEQVGNIEYKKQETIVR